MIFFIYAITKTGIKKTKKNAENENDKPNEMRMEIEKRNLKTNKMYSFQTLYFLYSSDRPAVIWQYS